MNDFKWRNGDFEDNAPDELFTKRLYELFSYLNKKTIYQKIWMSVSLGLLGLCVYLIIFPIFPNPPLKLIFLSSIHFMIALYYFRKTKQVQKEYENLRDEDLKRYDDKEQFT